MKYSCEVIINRPIDGVIESFDSLENLYKWQPTLKSAEPLSGELGKPGARMKFVYSGRGKDMTMIETITAKDLPETFDMIYEAPGVVNPCHNSFEDLGDGTTKWVMETEFRFTGFMAVASKFMKRAFPKETRSSMETFKNWIEST